MSCPIASHDVLVPHRARLHAQGHVVFRSGGGTALIRLERADGTLVADVDPGCRLASEDGDRRLFSVCGDADGTLDPGAYRLRLVAQPDADCEVTAGTLEYVLLGAYSDD